MSEDSVFQNKIVMAFVLHAELDAMPELRRALKDVDGVDIIYQRKSDDKLYITGEPPEDIEGGDRQ